MLRNKNIAVFLCLHVFLLNRYGLSSNDIFHVDKNVQNEPDRFYFFEDIHELPHPSDIQGCFNYAISLVQAEYFASIGGLENQMCFICDSSLLPKNRLEQIIFLQQQYCQYFKIAADSGHPRSMFFYGICLRFGYGCQKDNLEALKWIKQSADLGEAKAMHEYGTYLNRGFLVQRDEKEAFRYFKLAAEQNYNKSLFYLGLFYEYGDVVEKNLTEAIRCYSLAVRYGHPWAQESLDRLKKKYSPSP